MNPIVADKDEFIVVGIRSVFALDGASSAVLLWKDHFLPRRKEIKGMDGRYYGVFNILSGDDGRYEYVAGMAGALEDIPVGMVGWAIPAGRYAEVELRGLADVASLCRKVVTEWLPDSGYVLAPGPMFVCTENGSPESDAAVWTLSVPVETPEVLERLRQWQV